jgi:hypothetical protein
MFTPSKRERLENKSTNNASIVASSIIDSEKKRDLSVVIKIGERRACLRVGRCLVEGVKCLSSAQVLRLASPKTQDLSWKLLNGLLSRSIILSRDLYRQESRDNRRTVDICITISCGQMHKSIHLNSAWSATV